MFPREISATLTTLFKKESRSVVMFLQGPPGIGKTAAVGQAALAASKNLVTFALPTCESVDLRGLPTILDGKTKWASPLPRDGQGVILLDELSNDTRCASCCPSLGARGTWFGYVSSRWMASCTDREPGIG